MIKEWEDKQICIAEWNSMVEKLIPNISNYDTIRICKYLQDNFYDKPKYDNFIFLSLNTFSKISDFSKIIFTDESQEEFKVTISESDILNYELENSVYSKIISENINNLINDNKTVKIYKLIETVYTLAEANMNIKIVVKSNLSF